MSSMTESGDLSALLLAEGNEVYLYAAVSTIVALILATLSLTMKKTKPALDPAEWKAMKLVQKESISHDTRKFTFALDTPTQRLGLPIGQHISFRYTDAKDGKTHQRSYTPVTGDDTPGTVSFVIKVYKANVHPKFPEGGKMSQHLDSLSIGDTLDMRGPKGHLTYLGGGAFTVKRVKKPLATRQAKEFGLIAGGTGITPCLQIIHAVLKQGGKKDEHIKLSVLYANQTEDDILVRKELESYVRDYPDRFRLHYTLDRPPADWKHSKGFITKDMIEKHLPAKAADGSSQILMCGPPPMLKFACIPALTELGYTEEEYFSF